MELSILCDCEIAMVIFKKNQLYEYGSKDMNESLVNYLNFTSPSTESYSNKDYFSEFDTGRPKVKKDVKKSSRKPVVINRKVLLNGICPTRTEIKGKESCSNSSIDEEDEEEEMVSMVSSSPVSHGEDINMNSPVGSLGDVNINIKEEPKEYSTTSTSFPKSLEKPNIPSYLNSLEKNNQELLYSSKNFEGFMPLPSRVLNDIHQTDGGLRNPQEIDSLSRSLNDINHDIDGFNSGYRQYQRTASNQHIYPNQQFYLDSTYNRMYGTNTYYQQQQYSPRTLVGDYIPTQYNQEIYDIIPSFNNY